MALECDYLDDEVRSLLSRAERRMCPQTANSGHVSVDLHQARLEPALDERIYINQVGDVAVADLTCLSTIDKASTAMQTTLNHSIIAKNARTLSNDPSWARPAGMRDFKYNIVTLTFPPDIHKMPSTDLSPQLKRDLQLLKMRSALDPKRHYKKDVSKATFPDFAQPGIVVQGPTEYQNGRLARRARYTTLAEELLAAESKSGQLERKYKGIQNVMRRGKRDHYKKVMQRRSRPT